MTEKPKTDPALLAELGVPLTQRGHPDMRNHVPKRFVTLEEAQRHGWSLFWDGRACRFSHQSARSTSNPDRCVDCERVRAGKPALYPQARHQEFYKLTAPAKDAAQPVVVAPPPVPELSAADTRFLRAYVEHRDLAEAAKAAGCTPSQILSRRIPDSLLDKAMTKHEQDLSIPRYQPPPIQRAPERYRWTSETEDALCDLWVDCGLLQTALDQLGIRQSDYQKHKAESAAFADKIAAARPQALETARHRYLQGQDDKMLRVLESMDEEKNSNSKLTDTQVHTRLVRTITQLFQFGAYSYRVTATGQMFGPEELELCETRDPRISAPLVCQKKEQRADEAAEADARADYREELE